jgi:histone H3/H4
MIKKKRSKGGKMDVDLIIKSKIKAAVPDLSVAGEVPEALNKKILKILEEASQRAKLNGRRTLQARDL